MPETESFSSLFDGVYVVSLPEHESRLRRALAEAARLGLEGSRAPVAFSAVRPTERAGFPSLGARGCFLSHLGVLEEAQRKGHGKILILGDDVVFTDGFHRQQDSIVAELTERSWDFAFLGHGNPPMTTGDGPLRPHVGPLTQTHCYGVHGRVLSDLIAFSHLVMSRPPGHPDGGPMHWDGALNTFRKQNPEAVTLVASPSLADQFSHASDVTPRWFDRVPWLRTVAGAARYGGVYSRLRDRVMGAGTARSAHEVEQLKTRVCELERLMGLVANEGAPGRVGQTLDGA